jgi:hypothetical protein
VKHKFIEIEVSSSQNDLKLGCPSVILVESRICHDFWFKKGGQTKIQWIFQEKMSKKLEFLQKSGTVRLKIAQMNSLLKI